MPLLSIIVPVYRTEDYLPKCIDSILAQTFKDYELILIDDGSPDECGKICDEYAMTDKRIKVLHQENAGVSAARNAGLAIAAGEFIGFIDSDDWIEPEMYERLIASAQEYNSDLVFCSWYDNAADGTEKPNSLFANVEDTISVDSFYKGFFTAPRTVAGSCCNKIFRKNSIRSLFEESVAICEDNLFIARFVSNDTAISYVPKHLYHVYARENSATRADITKQFPSLRIREQIIHICGAVSRTGRDYAEMDYLNMGAYYCSVSAEDKRIREELKGYIRKHWLAVANNNAILWKTRILYLLQLF